MAEIDDPLKIIPLSLPEPTNTVDLGPRYTVWVDTEGPGQLLFCNCGRKGAAFTPACEHIAQAIIDEKDADLLWKSDNSVFLIPVSLKLNIWERVELRLASNGASSVHFIFGTSSVHIGYLFEGQGRSAIKLLLENWFESEFQLLAARMGHKEFQCTMSSHGIAAQKVWEMHNEFYRMWFLLKNSMCTYCKVQFDKSDSVDDLIPFVDDGPSILWKKQKQYEEERLAKRHTKDLRAKLMSVEENDKDEETGVPF